jgi:hypothetical protein
LQAEPLGFFAGAAMGEDDARAGRQPITTATDAPSDAIAILRDIPWFVIGLRV